MKTNRSWRGLRFTGDTNCGINWQAGFDVAGCPGDPNTLLTEAEITALKGRQLNASGIAGIFGGPVAAALSLNSAKNTADKAYQEALGNVRKVFPGPGACPTGTESLSHYQGNGIWTKAVCGSSCTYIEQALVDMRNALTDWHIPRGEQNYIAAYNTVIAEYTDYYNANCISTPKTADTVKVADTTAAGTAATPAAVTTATAAATTTTTTQPTIDGKAIIAEAKKIPSWVWWAIGGVAAAGIIYGIAKKGN